MKNVFFSIILSERQCARCFDFLDFEKFILFRNVTNYEFFSVSAPSANVSVIITKSPFYLYTEIHLNRFSGFNR